MEFRAPRRPTCAWLFVDCDFCCTQAGNGSSLSEAAQLRHSFAAGRRRIGAAGTKHAAGGPVDRAVRARPVAPRVSFEGQIPTKVLRQDPSRSPVHHCCRESGAADSTAGYRPVPGPWKAEPGLLKRSGDAGGCFGRNIKIAAPSAARETTSRRTSCSAAEENFTLKML